MEMVAASKMRKTQDAMESSRPYAQTMRKVIGHIALGSLEYQHPYLEEREAKRVGYIIVSTDRGLCGGLNINLFKKAITDIQQWNQQGAEVELALIGAKATAFFNSYGGNVSAQVSGLGDAPTVDELIGTVGVMLKKYDEGQLDCLYLVYNKFVNTMVQDPVLINCCLCLSHKMKTCNATILGTTFMSQSLSYCSILYWFAMLNHKCIKV